MDLGDKEKINKVLEDANNWLQSNQNSTKEEYEAKQKKLESVILPL